MASTAARVSPTRAALAATQVAPRPRMVRVATSISLNLILRRQMELLRDSGYQIMCVCDPDEWADRLEAAGFPVCRLGMGRRPGPLRMLAWSVRFYRHLRRHRVEIVHTHNAFHGIAGRVAARVAGVPLVVQTVHNWYYLDRRFSRLAPMYRALERLAARLSDAVLFLNREDFSRAIADRIVPAAKCRFIGNGIDIARLEYELAQSDRSATRASLAIGDDDVAILMVARLEPPKDHATFLRAMVRIRATIPRARAVLVGYGLEREQVAAEAVELGLEAHVDFLGYRHDVAAILTACDAVVLSSRQEGFGRCLVEAMVARKPIVATDVVGIRDVVRHGQNGLLVPFQDDIALAEAIVLILTDEELAGRLVEEGYERARNEFDEHRAADRVRAVYEELLAAHGSGRVAEHAP